MSEQEPIDLMSASDAYVRYCAGITIIQSPEKWTDLHNRPDIEANAEEILCSAERLMVDGVRRFIKASLPDNIATLQQASIRFDEVAPGMHSQLAAVASVNTKRLYDMNPRYNVVRPAAFLGKGIYTDITHSNYNRIHTADMLDGYNWSTVFNDLMSERTLAKARSGDGRLKLVRET